MFAATNNWEIISCNLKKAFHVFRWKIVLSQLQRIWRWHGITLGIVGRRSRIQIFKEVAIERHSRAATLAPAPSCENKGQRPNGLHFETSHLAQGNNLNDNKDRAAVITVAKTEINMKQLKHKLRVYSLLSLIFVCADPSQKNSAQTPLNGKHPPKK